MTIRPTSSGQTPRAGVRRTDPPGPAAPARPGDANAPAAGSVRRDDVRISAQARELQQHGPAGRGATGELAPERLRSVLERMAGGYYDRPEVRDDVLRRLTKDL